MDGITIASAGLVLGIAHAFEADHLAAVTTLAADPLRRDERGERSAPLLWAIGHAVALFGLGIMAIYLGRALPLDFSHVAERLVGPVLVLLGLRTMIRSGLFHRHAHEHGGHRHEHYHLHLGAQDHHGLAPVRTKSRHAPMLVGALHGIAGTGGALVLAASAGFTSPLQGAAFLALFGVGTVVAMSLYGGALSLLAGTLRRREPLVQAAMLGCGGISIAIGGYLFAGSLF